MTKKVRPFFTLPNLSPKRALSSVFESVKTLVESKDNGLRRRITTLFNAICADYKPSEEYTNRVSPRKRAVYRLDTTGAAIKEELKSHKNSARSRAINMASESPGKFFGTWNNDQNIVQIYYRLRPSENKEKLRDIFKNMGHSVFFGTNIKNNITEFDIIPRFD